MVDLVEKLDGTFDCLLKALMPAEIMMVSISIKVQFFKLIDVFLFNFVVPVLFYFVYKGPASI